MTRNTAVAVNALTTKHTWKLDTAAPPVVAAAACIIPIIMLKIAITTVVCALATPNRKGFE